MARHFKSDDSTSASRKPARQMKLSEGTESIRVLTAKDVRPEWEEKDRSGLRTFLGAIFGVLALLAMVLVVVGFVLNGSISLRGNDKTAAQSLADTAEGEPFYMLIVGTDSREDDYTGRNDALILARVDPSNAKVTLVSIPGDTMVNIGGSESVEKINASYAYYGATSTIETVSAFTGVPISHFMKLNFAGLKRTVEQMGGLTISASANTESGNGSVTTESGAQTLDGDTALGYLRERTVTSANDLELVQMQRLVVSAFIQQVLATQPTQLPQLVTSLAGSVSTDLNLLDLAKLALQFHGKDLTIYTGITPSYTFVQDGFSHLGTMFDEWRDEMKRVDAGLDPLDLETTIPEPQASDENLGAATNCAAPQDYKELAAQALAAGATATTGEAAEGSGE
ncbi:MAG: LCP family protein [Atopobiaceae bacterium]|nr:LCP family protein [Atopobiaceae bacterium]